MGGVDMPEINLTTLYTEMQKEMLQKLNMGAKAVVHPGTKGDNTEANWISWFQEYLPNRYKVDKGIVIDSTGKQSEQIDLIIYDAQYSYMVFHQNETLLVPAESVYAVFEVFVCSISNNTFVSLNNPLFMNIQLYIQKGNIMTIRLKYGNTNTYFVRGISGGLLIDTDYAGTLTAFYKALKANHISTADISYIMATHYHPDHIGLVSELTKLGIKLLLLDIQYNYVHFADNIFRKERHLKYEPIDEKNAVIITCGQSREFLARMGIAGEIVPTLSHSEDSISVILDNGDCIVGDLEPLEYLDAYENNIALQSDWKIVMSHKPKVIYYAHANEKRFM